MSENSSFQNPETASFNNNDFIRHLNQSIQHPPETGQVNPNSREPETPPATPLLPDDAELPEQLFKCLSPDAQEAYSEVKNRNSMPEDVKEHVKLPFNQKSQSKRFGRERYNSQEQQLKKRSYVSGDSKNSSDETHLRLHLRRGTRIQSANNEIKSKVFEFDERRVGPNANKDKSGSKSNSKGSKFRDMPNRSMQRADSVFNARSPLCLNYLQEAGSRKRPASFMSPQKLERKSSSMFDHQVLDEQDFTNQNEELYRKDVDGDSHERASPRTVEGNEIKAAPDSLGRRRRRRIDQPEPPLKMSRQSTSSPPTPNSSDKCGSAVVVDILNPTDELTPGQINEIEEINEDLRRAMPTGNDMQVVQYEPLNFRHMLLRQYQASNLRIRQPIDTEAVELSADDGPFERAGEVIDGEDQMTKYKSGLSARTQDGKKALFNVQEEVPSGLILETEAASTRQYLATVQRQISEQIIGHVQENEPRMHVKLDEIEVDHATDTVKVPIDVYIDKPAFIKKMNKLGTPTRQTELEFEREDNQDDYDYQVEQIQEDSDQIDDHAQNPQLAIAWDSKGSDSSKKDLESSQRSQGKSSTQLDQSESGRVPRVSTSGLAASSTQPQSGVPPQQPPLSSNSSELSENASPFKLVPKGGGNSITSSLEIERVLSDISEEDPLHNLLDTGRFEKKFKERVQIGQGGFGKVYKAIYHVDQKQYAIKVVRLHILKAKNIDPIVQIYKHRVYRELQAASRITSDNIVRYFNSWFEELNEDEKKSERDYRVKYNKRLQRKKQRKQRSKMNKLGRREVGVHHRSSFRSSGSRQSSMRSSDSHALFASPDRPLSATGSSPRLINLSKKRFQFGRNQNSSSQYDLAKSYAYKNKQVIQEELDNEDDDYDCEQSSPELKASQLKLKAQLLPKSPEQSKQTYSSSGECQKKERPQRHEHIRPVKISKSPQHTQRKQDLSKSLKNSRRSASVSIISKSDQVDDSSSSSSSSDSSSQSSDSSSSDSSSSYSSETESKVTQKSIKEQFQQEEQSKSQKLHSKARPSRRQARKSLKVAQSKPKPSLQILHQSKGSSDDSDDSDDDLQPHSQGSSQFSQITLNNYLKKKQQYQSVNMMIQMEYCSGQSLQAHLTERNQKQGYGFVSKNMLAQFEENGVIDREENLQIFSQVINGMAEIHNNQVIHRDLKPENIFIDKNQDQKPIAKIGDFGLARMLSTSNFGEESAEPIPMNTECFSPSMIRHTTNQSTESLNFKSSNLSFDSSVAGTEAYMAPEVKQHFFDGTKPQKYGDVDINKRQDIYQLGLILYEMCHKIKTNMQKNQLFRQLENQRTLSDHCPLLEDKHIEYKMILHMTERDPRNRPDAQFIINEYLPTWKREVNQEKGVQSSSPVNADSSDDEEVDEPIEDAKEVSAKELKLFPQSKSPPLNDKQNNTVRAEVTHNLHKTKKIKTK